MGNLTLNERVDILEVMVRGMVIQVEDFGKRIELLKQPVMKVKYRNRVKPLVKRDKDGSPVKKRTRRWFKKPEVVYDVEEETMA
uniref:Uncharacterized protein n=1 Tax=viral metagenome TaxID=1070528 RepID=A0A6H1ZEQ1_9ZZZZ